MRWSQRCAWLEIEGIGLASDSDRHIGLFGATGIGVGAIVGGGILALAGAAFAATGPSAVVAFALNGIIALLTALSFAEVSSKFPQSGGTYTFAKKVLAVESAFTVGWIVWFASIVAAVLYGIGFGQFAAVMISDVWEATSGPAPQWLTARPAVAGLALAAVGTYTVLLMLKSGGGGMLINITKVLVFALLIACGLWAMTRHSPAQLGDGLTPFFALGAAGLFQAMGFTFIALQGFDLIAAVAGEIKDPAKTIPKAMLLSLGIALLIYLPLLLIIAVVGFSADESVVAAAKENPETIVALAAQNYMGGFGYWMVMVAGVLSMASALQANLFAASRVAMAMSRDRNLPRSLARVGGPANTPRVAVLATAAIIGVIIVAIPNVAAAGAASSLIFLITFALVHWITILVRQRSALRPPPFRTPWFPVLPTVGGLSCLALAVYQGIAVPSAGLITLSWICLGGMLFLFLFAQRARLADASITALDPEVVALRGHSPLVLVPIARPESALGLVAMAHAIAPPGIGRVLLLSVVVVPDEWNPDEQTQPLENAQVVLKESLRASASVGVYPETLATVADEPWDEISRVAKSHRCETLLMGLSRIEEDTEDTPLEGLANTVDCDVVILRAPHGWRVDDAERILVPTGGRGGNNHLLARLLGSLSRSSKRQVNFVRIVPEDTNDIRHQAATRHLRRLAHDLCDHYESAEVIRSNDAIETVAEAAKDCDLLVLGVQRIGKGRKLFGNFVLSIARRVDCPIAVVCRR